MSKRQKKNEIEQGEVSLIPIMNLVCLLIPFLLYTASFVVFSTIDVSAQRNTPSPVIDQPPPPMSLTVVITDQGFRLASSGEMTLPPTCGQTSEGGGTLHIPLTEDGEVCRDDRGYPSNNDRQQRTALRLGPPSCAYDFDRLHQCMEDIKADHPDHSSVVISGESGTDYDVLVNTMDATRGTENAPLFPNVSIAAGVA